MEKSTMHFLLSRFMETEYQTEWLSTVSVESFNRLKSDMHSRFEDMLELTDTDIKEAWKAWFDWATYGGVLISPHLQFIDPAVSYKHDELRIMELTIEIANNAIDNL